ncbi:MAG: hypothetical protein KU38_10750 [Sulfurovum sp. FS08-3]|nr:MAG: hypothetical protein KU38_10750 [Sulfurovum sp. FS08-3]
MLSEETKLARKMLSDYENDFIDMVEENENFIFEIWKDPLVYAQCIGYKGEKYIDVFFQDTYTENFAIENDKVVNSLLKKYNDIDTLWIKGYSRELQISLLEIFDNLDNIRILKCLKYFKKQEYKNITTLKNLEKLEVTMYDLHDIDFQKFERLTRCMILMSRGFNTKEELQESKKYIKQLQKENPNIEFDLRID